MQHAEFTRTLTADGFQEVLTVSREAGAMGEHSHPFEARALILEGELRINCAGNERTYLPGQVFQLAANTPHSETYGPSGVKYLVGRKT